MFHSSRWEKNRNFFDFFSYGVEIRFSNFRLGKFAKVEANLGQKETLDVIHRVSTSDNSTPSGENKSALRPTVGAIRTQNDTSDEIDRVSTSDNSTPFGAN